MVASYPIIGITWIAVDSSRDRVEGVNPQLSTIMDRPLLTKYAISLLVKKYPFSMRYLVHDLDHEYPRSTYVEALANRSQMKIINSGMRSPFLKIQKLEYGTTK